MPKQTMIVKKGETPALTVLGTEVRFLCDADATDHAWSLMELAVPRDAGPPPHEHNWDEAYYITAGRIQFSIGTRSVLAATGDFIYAPAGIVHGFRGASDSVARMLIFDAPAHAGQFFKEVDREALELPRQLPKVLQIGARNGINFVQPS